MNGARAARFLIVPAAPRSFVARVLPAPSTNRDHDLPSFRLQLVCRSDPPVVLGGERAPDIADFSELGEFLSLPIRTYSAGMVTRLAFAISTAVQPDILLLDEVVAAGDVQFSKKARERTLEMADSASILVLAIHDMTTLRNFCSKLAVLRAGEIADIGPIGEVLERYEASAAA